MKKPRILIADDHPLVLAALRGLLEGHGEVVGTVTDGQALVKAHKGWSRTLYFPISRCQS